MIFIDRELYQTAAPGKTQISIMGTGNANRCYVLIGGQKYTGGATLTVETGTVIECVVNHIINVITINGNQTTIPSGETYLYTTKGGAVTFTLSYSFSGGTAMIDIVEGG